MTRSNASSALFSPEEEKSLIIRKRVNKAIFAAVMQ
jgi:hypothetical protein